VGFRRSSGDIQVPGGSGVGAQEGDAGTQGSSVKGDVGKAVGVGGVKGNEGRRCGVSEEIAHGEIIQELDSIGIGVGDA